LEEEIMKSSWTDLVDSIIADNPSNLTSEVLLGEVEELEPAGSMTWVGSNLSKWPVLVAENLTAFEDAVLLDPAPLIPDERSPGHLRIFLVTSAIPGKSDRFLTYLSVRTTTSPHIVVQDRVEPSLRKTRFSPDFFSIKRFMTYVMGRTRPSLLQPQRPPEALRDISISVHPQVVREAEEKTLTNDLETSIKLAQKTYSTLKSIDVTLEHDPEIVGRKRIRFTLTVSGEPELVLKDEFKFKEKLYSALDIKTCEQITNLQMEKLNGNGS